MLEPGESKTATFEIRPTGECGNCAVSGSLTYYDYSLRKRRKGDIVSKMVSIICPVLRRREINEDLWRQKVTRMLVAEEESLDLVDEELKLVSQTLSNHLKLKETLASQISIEKKQALINEIFQGRLSKTTLGFLSLLLTAGKINLLPEIVAAYTDLLQAVENKVIAEVTTAVPVTGELLSKLEAKLAEITGKRVSLRQKVDPTIIGGLVIRVDGKLIDASVKGQLSKLQEGMVKEVIK
jgi:F-type H+-transporting ATPase subunit delta